MEEWNIGNFFNFFEIERTSNWAVNLSTSSYYIKIISDFTRFSSKFAASLRLVLASVPEGHRLYSITPCYVRIEIVQEWVYLMDVLFDINISPSFPILKRSKSIVASHSDTLFIIDRAPFTFPYPHRPPDFRKYSAARYRIIEILSGRRPMDRPPSPVVLPHPAGNDARPRRDKGREI